MKKIFLLCALVCADQMYGMEPMEPERDVLAGQWQNLPTEVKSLIITAIILSKDSEDNLGQAIKNIVSFSRVNSELNKMINLNDLQGFTKIIHLFADEGGYSPYKIGLTFEEIKSPTAEKYVSLLKKLGNAMFHANLEEIKESIKEGADINGSNFLHGVLLGPFISPFGLDKFLREHGIDSMYFDRIHAVVEGYAINFGKLYNTLKLLLDHGANPNVKDCDDLQTPLELFIDRYKAGKYPTFTQEEYEQIKALLENAMKKYPHSGGNPNVKEYEIFQTPLELLIDRYRAGKLTQAEYEQIKALIEEAMQKYPPSY